MSSEATTKQIPPKEGFDVVLWEVLEDIKARAEFGKKKYGTYLQTFNGRDPLVDAYQEAIDLVMYLKQKIMEEKAARDKLTELMGTLTVDRDTHLDEWYSQ